MCHTGVCKRDTPEWDGLLVATDEKATTDLLDRLEKAEALDANDEAR